MFKGYNIVVGVTGSIAAYKTPEIVRWLDKNGAGVYVIMTEAATKIITPLTLRELSHHPVAVDQFQEPVQFNTQHISLAQKADMLVVVPATANIIGKIASGIADDLLSTTIMATKSPVLICPAMNTQMYLNPVVQRNINILKDLGYHFISPTEGELLCGQSGVGHLAALPEIQEKIQAILLPAEKKMHGIKVLVTAGGTREFIDPVRFIGNLSTGKMGVACARAAQEAGAEVTLIAANVEIPLPERMEVIHVVTAADMEKALQENFPGRDITVMVSAVSDFRPQEIKQHKIKREGTGELELRLIPNPDLSMKLAQIKTAGQVVVGFAAETENLAENAAKKLINKQFDLIVANDVTMPGSGFGSDTNKAILMTPDQTEKLPLLTKTELGKRIMDKAFEIWQKKQTAQN